MINDVTRMKHHFFLINKETVQGSKNFSSTFCMKNIKIEDKKSRKAAGARKQITVEQYQSKNEQIFCLFVAHQLSSRSP